MTLHEDPLYQMRFSCQILSNENGENDHHPFFKWMCAWKTATKKWPYPNMIISPWKPQMYIFFLFRKFYFLCNLYKYFLETWTGQGFPDLFYIFWRLSFFCAYSPFLDALLKSISRESDSAVSTSPLALLNASVIRWSSTWIWFSSWVTVIRFPRIVTGGAVTNPWSLKAAHE